MLQQVAFDSTPSKPNQSRPAPATLPGIPATSSQVVPLPHPHPAAGHAAAAAAGAAFLKREPALGAQMLQKAKDQLRREGLSEEEAHQAALESVGGEALPRGGWQGVWRVWGLCAAWFAYTRVCCLRAWAPPPI